MRAVFQAWILVPGYDGGPAGGPGGRGLHRPRGLRSCSMGQVFAGQGARGGGLDPLPRGGDRLGSWPGRGDFQLSSPSAPDQPGGGVQDPVRGINVGALAVPALRGGGRFVAHRLYRQPSSASNRVSCPPGWGRSGRANTRIAAGQTLNWSPAGPSRSSLVSSVTRFLDQHARCAHLGSRRRRPRGASGRSRARPCRARTLRRGLTCCSTLGARAHPSRLPVHGPGVRLAGSPGAK
jgi:hypothetical protein